MQRATLLLALLLCACMPPTRAAPAASSPKPVLLSQPTGLIMYVQIISIQDDATGERLTADIYVDNALLANNAKHFEYTIQAMETHTITVKSPGYRDFGLRILAKIDRNKQLVIPLKLQRK